ncbi:MAG: TM2 domain-containing protein [Ruminococcus sp.]|nr:TM2 domain-containing protein [Ruminococcus sp.]
MYCKQCGNQIDDGAMLCPKCGADQQLQTVPSEQKTNQGVATAQGEQQPPNYVVPNIVVNVDNHSSNTAVASAQGGNNYYGAVSVKSKWVALILAIFTGYFGLHRFYVGKAITGILYLCTVGLCGIGWIYDIIQICRGKFTDRYGLPLLK